MPGPLALLILTGCATAPGASQEDFEALQAEVASLREQLEVANAKLAALPEDPASLATDEELASAVGNVASLVPLASYVSVSTDEHGPRVVFSGVNVQIRDGSGSTESLSGLGNLIIGEHESSGASRTGAHNLIVGPYHEYTSWGGVLFGRNNTLQAENASVLGGHSNSVSVTEGVVVGGAESSAAGVGSVVIGGQYNSTIETASVVVGGSRNQTNGTGGVVLGGTDNDASAAWSVVLGNTNTTARSDYDVVP